MLNHIPDRVAGWFKTNRSATGKVLYVLDHKGCWIWQRAVGNNGYGAFGWHQGSGTVRTVAHRVAYLAFVGPIGEELELDHLCVVKLCVNPAHLEAVTGEENNRRAGNGPKTHCIRGHEMTEANVRLYRGTRNCRACKGERRAERAARGLPRH